MSGLFPATGAPAQRETSQFGASGGAAEVHGLQILEPSIQDIATNTTRFLVIGRSASPPTGDDRTSIMFCVQDKPGALFHAPEPFNRLKI